MSAPVGGRDRPDTPELARTVREFVDRIGERLEGADRYDALCASYLLDVIEREAQLGAELDEEERALLAAFLGRDGDLATLRAEFQAQFKSGACDARWDEAFALVLTGVVAKVRVSRPEYLEPEHRQSAT